MSTLNLMQALPVTVFTCALFLPSTRHVMDELGRCGACGFGAVAVLPIDEPRRRLAVDSGPPLPQCRQQQAPSERPGSRRKYRELTPNAQQLQL